MRKKEKPSNIGWVKLSYLWLNKSLGINLYYFGFVLLGLIGLNIFQFVSLNREGFSSYLFLMYSFGQSFIEVAFFIFIGSLLKRFCPISIFYCFISLCFFFLIIHCIDFLLIRFMDMSIYYALDLAVHETWDNFVELIRLSEIKLQRWILFIVFCAFVLPLLAIGLYLLLEKVQKKWPISCSRKGLLTTFFALPLGLVILDIAGTSRVPYENYCHYCRMLPWKSTLITKEGELIKLSMSLKPLPSGEEMADYLSSMRAKLKSRPNIYLFVIESLREDFISYETAPTMTRLREENISLGQTFSGANATQQSWYSIFHSNYALHWSYALKNKYRSGSLPLQLIKQLGYQIHVYSAAQLKYYHLSEMIFGKDHTLADSYHIYPHYFPIKSWQSDSQAVGKFLEEYDSSLEDQGNLCIFFLDSTHFNYSWPDNYKAPFKPFSEEGTNLNISNSATDIMLLQNRYRNAIHFADSLLGKVIDKIKEKNLYEESVIVLTGDHGEEFFEEGQLFHASHLSRMQTRVPIYYKLGDNSRAQHLDTAHILSSHIDIFPTLFDYLTGSPVPNDFCSGESIFASNRFPFIVSARYNGGKSPSTFFIHNGNYKLTAKIKRGSSKTVLEVLSIKDTEGNVIPCKGFSSLNHPFYRVYAPALDHIFSYKGSVKN